MSSGENVLWVVESHPLGFVYPRQARVFRTRAAAVAFQKAKNDKSKTMVYTKPQRATWGPEQ